MSSNPDRWPGYVERDNRAISPHTVRPCPPDAVYSYDWTKLYVFQDGPLFKVGISCEPVVRLRALNAGRRKDQRMKIRSLWLCVGCEAQAVERRAHIILAEYLAPERGREFFRCSLEVVEAAIAKAAADTNPDLMLEGLRLVTDAIHDYALDGPIDVSGADLQGATR